MDYCCVTKRQRSRPIWCIRDIHNPTSANWYIFFVIDDTRFWGQVMHRPSLGVFAGVLTFAFAQFANAADLPVKVKPPPIVTVPAYSWTGFYFGANIGGGWSNKDVDYVPNDPLSTIFFYTNNSAPPPASASNSGLIGGLQLGYNWQLSPAWLIGVEADFDWTGVKGSTSTGGTSFAGVLSFSNAVEQKVKWFGTVRGRLGYLPAPNLLAFVTGGFAYGRVEQSGAYTTNAVVIGFLPPFSFLCSPNVPCFAGSSSHTAYGWTVGGGLEYALWQHWTIRGEYLYISLGNQSVTETATAVAAAGATPSSFNANFGRTNLNIARVALSYRF